MDRFGQQVRVALRLQGGAELMPARNVVTAFAAAAAVCGPLPSFRITFKEADPRSYRRVERAGDVPCCYRVVPCQLELRAGKLHVLDTDEPITGRMTIARAMDACRELAANHGRLSLAALRDGFVHESACWGLMTSFASEQLRLQ